MKTKKSNYWIGVLAWIFLIVPILHIGHLSILYITLLVAGIALSMIVIFRFAWERLNGAGGPLRWAIPLMLSGLPIIALLRILVR